MPPSLVRRLSPALLAAATFAACDGGTGPAARGALEVVASTSGRVLDRDGYGISVDGGAIMKVPANGTVSVPELKAGAHTVAITGLSDNCTLQGAASRSVTVASGTPTRLTIDVGCVADRFAYLTGLGNGQGSSLFLAKVDGSGSAELQRGIQPGRLDWSPDGHFVLFVRRDDDFQTSVWKVDAQTRDSTRLTTGRGENLDPVWSPDGTRIAFVSAERTSNAHRLTVMNADGSGLRTVTGVAGPYSEMSPAWSPDGTKIVFRRLSSAVYEVNVNGGGERLVANTGTMEFYDLAWSPDGAWIVWSGQEGRSGHIELFRVRPDGTGMAAVTATPGSGERWPSFMPDERIVYSAEPPPNTRMDAWSINVDGTGRTNLTNTPEIHERASVWP